MSNPALSIIVPVLNEEGVIAETLSCCQPYRDRGAEIIVVDGGSTDRTRELANSLADKVLVSPRGRSRQQNCGAREAAGEWLLFLHGDTFLPEYLPVLDYPAPAKWGFFPVRLSGDRLVFRVIGRMISWRSRLFQVATGDQCLFFQRDFFDRAGGFPEIPLMEDVSLTRKLRWEAKPAIPRTPVTTSSRRWEENGVWRTILLMWWLRIAFFAGVSAERINRWYAR